jgi:hypothetical protein
VAPDEVQRTKESRLVAGDVRRAVLELGLQTRRTKTLGSTHDIKHEVFTTDINLDNELASEGSDTGENRLDCLNQKTPIITRKNRSARR